jgi:serine/threonine-protein kinase
VFAAFAEGSIVEPWVAIKLLPASTPRDAWHAELRIAARLDHPLLVPVIDAGETEGRPFIAMPMVLGETIATASRMIDLHAERARLAIPPLLAARAIVDACEALHHAHELEDEAGSPLGVVHRDVSPANLLVGVDGMIRVLDFGAVAATQIIAETTAGAVRGTLGYVAPERLEHGQVDRRVDVWALAVVLWEWIAGARLYAGNGARDVLAAMRARPAPALRDVVPDAPLALEEVLARALSRDPERRPPTARAFGRELLACIAEEGGAALGAADLAGWLETLAPGAAKRQRRLLQRSRRAPRSERPPRATSLDGKRDRVALAGTAGFVGGLICGMGLGRVW